MIFDFMGMFVPLLVGTIFSAVGVGFLSSDRFFKKNGRKINGVIKAIEKYKSTTTSNGHRQTVIYYRPIAEYIYQNQTRIVKGVGSGEIGGYKPGQTVPILILDDPESDQVKARIANDSASVVIGVVFSIVGMCALAVHAFMGGVWIFSLVAFFLSVVAGRVFSSMACGFKADVFSSEDSQEIPLDSVLIETKEDYVTEISSHKFWGKLIAYGLMLASFGIMYAGYDMLPNKASDLLSSDFNEFWGIATSGEMPSSWGKALMVFGIGAFFFLASLRFVYYVSRKYGGANRV